ncbi:MerR family transcriptional regulator [Saccharomonospora cyanea]|uniref:Putative transcriptional regulator n=1 Tax=Saccharomonospora cyanea NA-134 TaxID=882082 RepID=H5XPF0_9PSEU|nr:MerR family transcriptional regulator [Saccharomonospora cyanea]EHR58984.1 putative transcriptional regulator [Saccharomonospora cyanea NA-134]
MVGQRALRPVDLARAAGVSTQQIRNYADAGILPPAPRTPTGYRVFSQRHRDALLTYRALVVGAGPQAAQELMAAANAGDRNLVLALLDAVHADLHETRRSLKEMAEALEAVARQDAAPPPHTDLRIGDVARHLGVRTSALRVWETEGLLKPRREKGTRYRVFSPTDVREAQMIHMLRQVRYPLPRIGPVLDALRQTGSTEALLAAVATRTDEVNRRATALLEASALLHTYLSEARDDAGEQGDGGSVTGTAERGRTPAREH